MPKPPDGNSHDEALKKPILKTPPQPHKLRDKPKANKPPKARIQRHQGR